MTGSTFSYIPALHSTSSWPVLNRQTIHLPGILLLYSCSPAHILHWDISEHGLAPDHSHKRAHFRVVRIEIDVFGFPDNCRNLVMRCSGSNVGASMLLGKESDYTPVSKGEKMQVLTILIDRAEAPNLAPKVIYIFPDKYITLPG